MEPLTLGHLMLLDSLESPALSAPENLSELALRVFVCSQRWETSRRDLDRWWAPAFFAFWARRLLWRKADIITESERWHAYIRDNAVGPEVLSKKDSKAPTSYGSPFHYQVASVAMSRLKMTWEESIRVPILRIKCLMTALGELDGSVKLWTPQQEELWRVAQEEDAKEANGTT